MKTQDLSESDSHGELINWKWLNVYAPAQPSSRLDFYNTLRQKLTANTRVGGDWNTVSDTTLD
eukprot:6855937-Prymnesium_polylepis.1